MGLKTGCLWMKLRMADLSTLLKKFSKSSRTTTECSPEVSMAACARCSAVHDPPGAPMPN